MKKILFAMVLAGVMSAMNGQAQEITFEEIEFDFGQLDELDGSVSHDFRFTNTGSEPLIIEQVITGCGCTSAKWSEKPYKPGEKGVVRITYHPENRKMESFSIPTEVFTNLETPATLTITGKVTLAKHPYVNYYDPTKGERKEPKLVEPKDDYELVLQRVRKQLYESMPVEQVDKNATSLMKLMTPEGTWPQIDYKCFFRTNWEPADHLNRIKRMAMAYTNPESTLYGNQVLFRAIDKALRAWNEYSPTSYNWWYNEISAPKVMADILALLQAGYEKPADSVLEGLMEMMKKSDPRKWTGANKQDIAMHHMIRGCVIKDDSVVSTNVSEFFEPIKITDFEGIREDLSYQQHNNQLYIGGYGTVFVNNISLMAPLFTGTKFALSPEQVKLFSDFVRGTYLNVFRSRYMDFGVCGRSVSRVKTLDLGDYAQLFKKMKELDPENAKEYDDAAKRFATKNATIGRYPRNKMYYTSDYMLHNRPRYDFSVRAVSLRTCRSESGNGENLWGTYLSEGATNIRVNGDEYVDIFAVWEWDKIPGTTTPAGEVENHNDWGVAGVAEFVGGVSDGMFGVMTYGMNDYGMKANKSWFMFDNEVMCLGAGIEAAGTNSEINTSVNQCHLQGDVYLIGVDGTAGKMNPQSLVNQSYQGWVWHNKVGYYFPEATPLQVRNTNQTGRWSKVNFNQSGDEVTMPIFNMWIGHGSKPQQASYAYLVLPGIASPASLKVYDVKQIQLLSNNAQLQAVGHAKLDMLQAVFYAPGEVKWGNATLKAGKPCVVMVKNLSSENPEILVADPTQKETLQVGTDIVLTK
ncbi:MAG: DUF1573 domain-containing protein [Mediterranea massiliensis]|nr:DUF1573 domain-containing protein [Mediterranea massiliensis]